MSRNLTKVTIIVYNVGLLITIMLIIDYISIDHSVFKVTVVIDAITRSRAVARVIPYLLG